MKISLTLGPRRPLDRQMAWGCLTTNLAMPGCGSLVAGRAVGYVQATIALVGLILTTVFGVRFIIWFISNRTRLTQPTIEAGDYFREVWFMVRWALLGMAVFLFAWLWALVSSIGVLQESPRETKPPLLPK